MVLADTFNPYTLGVAVVAFAIVIVIVKSNRPLRIRTGNVEVDSGTLEQIATSVEQVARQVNHVDDPETEPTLREMVGAMHQQLTDVRGAVVENTRTVKRAERRIASVEAAQLAQAERLGEVGRLARQTADAIGRVEHNQEDDQQ